MGQQQLILLVLATVIVGVAIVVGIRAFTENSAKANADAMMQSAVRIANDMQAWKKKPAPFGGQATVATATQVADPDNFTGLTWQLLGYTPDTNGNYVNLDGTFSLPATVGEDPLITATNTQEGNTVVVAVCGMDDNDILGVITVLNGANVGTAPTCPS